MTLDDIKDYLDSIITSLHRIINELEDKFNNDSEIRQIKMNLTLFEQGVEEFMKKAEQVKNDNIELAKENDSLKKRIAELEEKLKNK